MFVLSPAFFFFLFFEHTERERSYTTHIITNGITKLGSCGTAKTQLPFSFFAFVHVCVCHNVEIFFTCVPCVTELYRAERNVVFPHSKRRRTYLVMLCASHVSLFRKRGRIIAIISFVHSTRRYSAIRGGSGGGEVDYCARYELKEQRFDFSVGIKAS